MIAFVSSLACLIAALAIGRLGQQVVDQIGRTLANVGCVSRGGRRSGKPRSLPIHDAHTDPPGWVVQWSSALRRVGPWSSRCRERQFGSSRQAPGRLQQRGYPGTKNCCEMCTTFPLTCRNCFSCISLLEWRLKESAQRMKLTDWSLPRHWPASSSGKWLNRPSWLLCTVWPDLEPAFRWWSS